MKKQILVLTIVCFLLNIANGYLFNYINDNYFHLSDDENPLFELPKIMQLILGIIIAPIIETVLCQVLPFAALNALKVVNKKIFILIPSVLFALMHTYHWLYVAMAFFIGLVLNYYYYKIQTYSEYAEYSFALTALLHALHNLYGFLFII